MRPAGRVGQWTAASGTPPISRLRGRAARSRVVGRVPVSLGGLTSGGPGTRGAFVVGPCGWARGAEVDRGTGEQGADRQGQVVRRRQGLRVPRSGRRRGRLRPQGRAAERGRGAEARAARRVRDGRGPARAAGAVGAAGRRAAVGGRGHPAQAGRPAQPDRGHDQAAGDARCSPTCAAAATRTGARPSSRPRWSARWPATWTADASADPKRVRTQLARIGNSISPVSGLACGGGPNCCTWAVSSRSAGVGSCRA